MKRRGKWGEKNTWGRQCKILSCKCSGFRWWHHPELSLLWSHSANHRRSCFALWREQASWALALTGDAKVDKKRTRGISQNQKYECWNKVEHWTWNASVLNALCTAMSFQDCSVDLSESNSYDTKSKHRDQQGPMNGCWTSLLELINLYRLNENILLYFSLYISQKKSICST